MILKLNKKSKNENSKININNLESKSIINTLKAMEDENDAINTDGITIIEPDNHKNHLIEIKDVHKSFISGKSKKEVLKGITFNINENENVAILGGNGAGKTALVETIVGLNKPSSGTIKFNYEYKNSYLEKIGIQFQDSIYPPGLSVKNIIDFVIEIFNFKITDDELKSLIKIFGIESFYRKRASSLSGGQSQRLNALIAIIQKPKVIFLDELSTGLDISIRTRIREFIKEYAKENNMTIVVVSHDIGEIDYLCEKIIFLKNGKIIINADKKTILKKYQTLENFVTTFIHN